LSKLALLNDEKETQNFSEARGFKGALLAPLEFI